MSVRILLADDHHLVRQALRSLLQAEGDLELIGEAGDGLQALAAVEAQDPDVLLLDLVMPGLNGLEVVRQVSRRFPRTKTIVLSMHADESYVIRALQSGAAGYVLKQADVGDLLRAVREVVAGRHYLSPPLTERAIEEYVARVGSDTLDVYDTLTDREREVLQLTAEGHTSGETGALLHISPRTVESHRAHVLQKLGLKGQKELVRFAVERGIVSSG